MNTGRFYLACFRDNVGSNVSWHGKNGGGYYTDISKAHVYTLEEAQENWGHAREYDQPISADKVDELAIWKVDCQYIPRARAMPDGCETFVAFKSGKYDGNDVYWSAEFELTTDFTKAKKLSLADLHSVPGSYVVIPFEIADKAKRKTFDFRLFDMRKMVTAAGLRMPERVKKQRRKKQGTGKTRWNCPVCGKISWQYNPYDYEGCNDHCCDGYRV